MEDQKNEGHGPSKRPRLMDQLVNFNYQLPTDPFSNGQPYFDSDIPPSTSYSLDPILQFLKGGAPQINHNYATVNNSPPYFVTNIPPSSTSYSLDPQLQFLEGGAPLLNHNYALPDQNLEDGYDYFSSLPPGYKFYPTNAELLQSYLIPKILRQPLPLNKIPEVNFYDHNPDTLAATYEKCGKSDWYFFTPRSKKHPKGKRPSRSAADGFWKAVSSDLKVTDNASGRLLGYRMVLVYYRGTCKNKVKTNWIMHEFRVSKEVAQAKPSSSRCVSDPMLLDEWVLCRIHHRPEKPSNMNGSRGVDNDHGSGGETSASTDTTAPPVVSPSETPAIETPVASAPATSITAPSAVGQHEISAIVLPQHASSGYSTTSFAAANAITAPPDVRHPEIPNIDDQADLDFGFDFMDFPDGILNLLMNPDQGRPTGFETPNLNSQRPPHDPNQ